MSDEQMTKLNFVDLEKLWNFVVGSILIWNHLVMQKLRLNFKIWIFQMILDGKTTKMKIVDLKKL